MKRQSALVVFSGGQDSKYNYNFEIKLHFSAYIDACSFKMYNQNTLYNKRFKDK